MAKNNIRVFIHKTNTARCQQMKLESYHTDVQYYQLPVYLKLFYNKKLGLGLGVVVGGSLESSNSTGGKKKKST